MEGEQPFGPRVRQALDSRRSAIQSDELPKLKELFRVFHSSFQGLHQLLLRKGLIQGDPYKSEQKISDINTPGDDPYIDSERDMVVGVRLDAYDNILEFLNNYFEFRLEVLGFRELKRLTELTRYISWDSLTSHSSKPTTRGIADLIGRARGGHDSFANSIISDSLDQLARNSEAIIAQIKVITTYRREEYKQIMREQLLPTLSDPGRLSPDDPAALDEIRAQHKALGLAGPFIPELASELLAEEHGPDADRRRAEVLERLRAGGSRSKKPKPKESLREVLISAIRAMAAASRPLEAIGENLKTNAEVARGQASGFGQKFREWIDRLTNRRPTPAVYQVEYTEETTGTRHTESIALDEFVERIAKKSQLYGAFLVRAGAPWAKIEKASDEQLYQYINKELGECHIVHRRAGALDTHLKSKAQPAERKKMKGVKIELTSVRNAIVKANQLKHEYVAKKEEEEQLRKLGVDT